MLESEEPPTNSVDGIKGFHGTFAPNGDLSPSPLPWVLGGNMDRSNHRYED